MDDYGLGVRVEGIVWKLFESVFFVVRNLLWRRLMERGEGSFLYEVAMLHRVTTSSRQALLLASASDHALEPCVVTDHIAAIWAPLGRKNLRILCRGLHAK